MSSFASKEMILTSGRLYTYRRRNYVRSEHNNERNGGHERMTLAEVIDRDKLLLGMPVTQSRMRRLTNLGH